MSISLSLKGASIADDGYVDAKDIGEGVNALHCHANKPDCYNLSSHRVGEWFLPNGSEVQIKRLANVSRDYYYRNRGLGVVLLNRVNNPSEKGLFYCEVPNANNESQIIYVNISKWLKYRG